jgi:fructokinase
MASGPAIEARWGSPAPALPAGHPAWELEAYYLSQAMCDLIYVVSPRRIVLGGGVMNHEGLVARIRAGTRALLAEYVQPLADPRMVDELIVPAALGENAGIVGALELAFEAGGG